MKFANANKLERKSGGVTDLRFPFCPSDLTALNKGHHPPLCHPDPDFLYVAPSIAAYAAFNKESRIGSANAAKLHRKSGGAQPRDLQCAFPYRNCPCISLARLFHPDRNVTQPRDLLFHFRGQANVSAIAQAATGLDS
jgi:hypothetical protein